MGVHQETLGMEERMEAMDLSKVTVFEVVHIFCFFIFPSLLTICGFL